MSSASDDDQNRPKPPVGDATRVDLGDDLLEFTATDSQPADSLRSSIASAASSPRPESEDSAIIPDEEFAKPIALSEIEDQLQSAKILMGEGLVEEAKKILRRILIADPHHVLARQTLSGIHELELKQIFGEERKIPSFRRRRAETVLSDLDAERIMRSLDRDLGLGMFGESAGLEQGVGLSPTGFPMRSEPKALQEYAESLERQLQGVSGQDRIDLGIAFLEMGIPEIAAEQFKAACRILVSDPEVNESGILPATALLAYALILVGRAFDATITIQAVLRDTEILHENKTEFFYLMGRAYETMAKPDIAQRWYEQVRESNPRYRDVEMRLRGIKAGQGPGPGK